jgi:hypothetical protein
MISKFKVVIAALVVTKLLTVLFPVDALAAGATLGLVTGSSSGTYIKIGQDVAQVAGKQGVQIDVKESSGSIENIKRINSSENASLGILQSDVLNYLKRLDKPEFQDKIKDLRVIYPLYSEEVHVFGKKEITSLKDLNGKRVAVGEEGSGSWLTAMNLFSILDIKPAQIVRTSPAKGVAEVIRKSVDAAIFVGGKPLQLFKNLENYSSLSEENKQNLQSFHFIPVVGDDVLSEYDSSQISDDDYSFVSGDVATVSVRSLLVSYDFAESKSSTGKARCEAIGKTAAAIRNNLKQMQEDKTNFHPKWADVNLDAEIKTWKRDDCAEAASEFTSAEPEDDLEKALLGEIRQKNKPSEQN